MANAITKPGGRSLSTDIINRLLSGIAASRSSTIIPGGKPLLRLMRSGGWVFGQANDPVQEGSQWIVNTMSIQHGWSCWTAGNDPKVKNTLLGEQMVPIFEPKPIKPEDVQGFPYKEQRVFDLKCVLGDDEGVEVLYKNASVGGIRGVDNFLAILTEQLETTPDYPCAIVQLESKPYDHNAYGQIFNPVFEVVGFATMDGERMPIEETEEATEVEEELPASLRAAVAKPPLKPAKPSLKAQTVAAPASMRPGAPPRRQRPSTRT